MKYRCNVVKDLTPLCLDQAASEESKQVVLEHLAECKSCMDYYEKVSQDLMLGKEEVEPENKYMQLAAKLRKKRMIKCCITSIIVCIFIYLCINYVEGYRFSSQQAADISGRLNYKSKVIGNYEWDEWKFYFYNSYSCYDVVLVKKTWHGWKATDSCLNWPKWSLINDQVGIEMAGALNFWSYDQGIQVFPFISTDENVKKVEVTIFGQTKTVDIENNKFMLLTFEGKENMSNDATGKAYDIEGNVIYTLESERGYWFWKEIQ